MTRALISVSDKRCVVDLARAMVQSGIEILSTGGTARVLGDAGIAVTDVADATGFPEILDGRVKTLHPAVHAGLLARRGQPAHDEALAEHGIQHIDWVVVNLYPFRDTIERPGVTLEEAVDQIDIGGPAMIRAAAKNHRDVTVVVDPDDYAHVIGLLRAGAPVPPAERTALAGKAFRHTAAYDAIIARYLSEMSGEEFPEQLTITLDKVQDLRYGENPHQQAAFYALPGQRDGTIAGARQHQGKDLSYNNISDANAALAAVCEFEAPTVVVVKHTNPCGVATASTVLEAWQRAVAADPVSAFGGIVACNRPVDAPLAAALCGLFLEVVIAPSFTEEALALLAGKENLRLLEVDTERLADLPGTGLRTFSAPQTTGVVGGVLVQHADQHRLTLEDLRIVTTAVPSDQQLEDLLFGWRVVKHVKSNAVVLAADGQTVGIGAGQMNRVGAARIAIDAAGEQARGSVLASDAFFPMPDSIEAAAAAGIAAIIQPGGSRRDPDVIAAADAAGLAMVFTGIRHFRH